MKKLGWFVVALSIAIGGALPLGVARSAAAADPVRIAIIDTGINEDHQEFAPDQVVAWKDFVNGRPDPYDDNGHGTLVASMAAGLNSSPAKFPHSLAPATELIVAKAANAGGVIGDFAGAVYWAVDQGADIINASFYSYVPLLGNTNPVFAAFDYARSQGVLVVVCNGNGLLNAGIPLTPGWLTAYDTSPSVLSVGAAGNDSLNAHTDPEVAAVFRVTGAASADPSGYVGNSGTSFASPYVAGFAARLVMAARAAGRTLGGAELEQLVKLSARDTTLLPTFEGYGVIDAGQLPGALVHAANPGTLPTRAADDFNVWYVDTVLLPTLRQLGRLSPI